MSNSDSVLSDSLLSDSGIVRSATATSLDIRPVLMLGVLLTVAALMMPRVNVRVDDEEAQPVAARPAAVESVVVTPRSMAPSVYDREAAMSPSQLMSRWDTLIDQASRKFHVPKSWIRAVMQRESGGRTMMAPGRPIVSSAGAMGLMQVQSDTYEEMAAQYNLGANPFDAHDNIFAGAAYLRWLQKRYGFPAMFAAYNAGPGRVDDHLQHGASLPAETRKYVGHITTVLGKGEAGRNALRRGLLRIPAQAPGAQGGEVGVPLAGLVAAERVQHVPGVDAGVVPVVEQQAHRIVAHRLDADDGHVALARHGAPLIRAVALHLGARAFHPQVFRGQAEMGAVVERRPPPAVSGRRLKLRYMTQAKMRPPSFIIFASRSDAMPTSYLRYLMNSMRETFDMPGTPIRLWLRSGKNPYAKAEH